MSHPIFPLPHRKKLPKHPSVSLNNNPDKLKKVTSTSSYVELPQNGVTGQKSDSSNNDFHIKKSKILSNFNKNSTIHGQSNDQINERKNSNSNFNGKKQPVNSSIKPIDNCISQIVQANRNLEKESDLVGMLGKKLYLAESQMQRMQTIMSKADDRLKNKDQEIGRLKRKVREWEIKFNNQELVHKKDVEQERKRIENSEYLYKRCLMLEHKIYEMEKFLADYGMVWVGDTDNKPNASSKKSNDYLKNCYTQLMANIEELNLAVGKGEVHVHRDKGGGGASFKTSSCMSLKFYKNGLIIQNGRFRPYEDASTATFIRDILDGYFPSELQEAYPNGVPFKVEDHRTETFYTHAEEFPGHGYRLGKVFPGRNDSDTLKTGSRQGTTSVRSSLQKVEPRQNNYTFKPVVPPLLQSDAKSKSFSDTPDMMHLRSQIMASHNNNCSDYHIQSHINAELVLSSRSEKKRELATKNEEYHISIKERTLKSKGDNHVRSKCFAGGSRTNCHNLTDRSLDHIAPGRLENTRSDDGRSRLRSTSLPGRRLRPRSLSKSRISTGNPSTSGSNTCNYTSLSNGIKKPRATKSATLERNTAVPLLHQINEPSGNLGELRLKIRSLNGSTVYLVHLCPDDTVARLYHLLDTCLVKTRLRGYKVVISGYAPKRLEQLNLSLKEYGILRDSVLHIVNDSAT